MKSKKVLIITYYWPPAGGPGVQRWLKFVKYLPEFGIEPIVYIPENPTYPIVDEGLRNDVPHGVTIIRKKIFEPYALASMLTGKTAKKISSGIIPVERKQTFIERMSLWIRGNIFVPDPRIFWVRPSVKFLEDYIKEHHIETVITTGPPHSLHLIGLKLKHKMNINWIADFRDPWTTIGYHKSLKLTAFSEDRHKNLEQKVLENADRIIVTSPSTKAEFRDITPKPIDVITNGYDVAVAKSGALDKKFTLAHIGSLLSERNPMILWQVLAELVREVPDFATDFELKLIGTVSNDILLDIHRYDLDPYLNFMGYLPHHEAILHQKQSQVLLLIEINSVETKGIIPGKVFEYMVSGRPIIGIGPTGSDFAQILDETKTGVFIDYSEKEKLKQTILDYHQQYHDGNLSVDAAGIEQYSRKNLTARLAALLQ
jgi:glycosyltransferase involved in cell wall biosynthesis